MKGSTGVCVISTSAASTVVAGVTGSSTTAGAGGGVAGRSDTADGTGDCRGSEGTEGVYGAACTGICACVTGGVGM